MQESVVGGQKLSVQDPPYIQETEEKTATLASSVGSIATSQRYGRMYRTVCKQGYGGESKQTWQYMWSAHVACDLHDLVHGGAPEDMQVQLMPWTG